MTNYLFSFEDLTSKDKAVRQIQRAFTRLGVSVVQTDIPTTIRRRAGISFREVNLTFADGQVVTFSVKKTGDIFQVKLNGKQIPIRNQDDQQKAMKEIADAMDKGRAAFQKRQALVQVKPPSSVHTAAPKMEKVLSSRKEELQKAIAEAKAELESLKKSVAETEAEIAKYQADPAI